MGLFSKKEDTKHIKDFDMALANLNLFAQKFREVHFASLDQFEKNFQKEKTEHDLRKERAIFDSHLGLLDQMKRETDVLLDEAFKIVRSETMLTEKDRREIQKVLTTKTAPTSISMAKK